MRYASQEHHQLNQPSLCPAVRKFYTLGIDDINAKKAHNQQPFQRVREEPKERILKTEERGPTNKQIPPDQCQYFLHIDFMH
ncbi:MAG: hypothetical protein COA75_01865 [Cellvibrionales bacterium]|nr:MAG: hypothetical protein COA75_01865 [Cellvibrionales bacterium]